MKQPMGMFLPGYFGRGCIKVHAGPYADFPGGSYSGIKLDKRVHKPYSLFVDIKDFTAPTPAQVVRILDFMLDELVNDHRVYLGCYGGMGRTGTILACLAKLWGEDDPIGYTRRYYWDKAVETSEQIKLVGNIRFPLKLRLKAMTLKTTLFFLNRPLIPELS